MEATDGNSGEKIARAFQRRRRSMETGSKQSAIAGEATEILVQLRKSQLNPKYSSSSSRETPTRTLFKSRNADTIFKGSFSFILKVSHGYGNPSKNHFRVSFLVSQSGETEVNLQVLKARFAITPGVPSCASPNSFVKGVDLPSIFRKVTDAHDGSSFQTSVRSLQQLSDPDFNRVYLNKTSTPPHLPSQPSPKPSTPKVYLIAFILPIIS